MARGRRRRASCGYRHWVSTRIGTLPTYLTAQIAALQRRIDAPVPFEERLEGLWVADDAVISDRGTRLQDVVAASGSKVADGASVTRSVLCEGVIVGPGAVIEDSVLLLLQT